MKYIILSQRTKKEELKVSSETKKAFEKYYKNLCYLNYENDVYDVKTLMESWLVSFAESEEFKEIQKQAEEKAAEEKREKEEEKAKREAAKKERADQKIAKLRAQIEELEK